MPDDLSLPVQPPTVMPPGGLAALPMLSISTNDGGGVTIGQDGTIATTDGAPAVHTHRRDEDARFDENLAAVIDSRALGIIAEECLQGIDSDLMTRSGLIDNWVKGVDLLGTRIQTPGEARGRRTSISKVGHPLLIMACTKYQAAAAAELLPAGGPAKIQIAEEGDDPISDAMAQSFEKDFNYYLTKVAKEYYPDTRRMLMYQAYGGQAYKKVFRCPMRRRPVSESIYLPDLIVSEDAISLETALRVTHQTFPTRPALMRMQLAGMYRPFDVTQPQSTMDPARMKVLESQGLQPMASRPQDLPFTLYECDVDLMPEDFGGWADKWERASPDGMPLPYKVTILRETRQVIAMWRNWRDGDPGYLKRNMYVKYGLVPSLGFYDWGFLHLLGNQTVALRAIWRLLIDAGYFSNFPGGVKIKGVRFSTNEIAPGPGEWPDVDIPEGNDLSKALMPMPYKGPSDVFIQLAEMIQQDYQQLAGTVELPVGEGSANVPVGTIMAQIEQQTQIMGGVHKGNHTSQEEELNKLRELFVEFPEDLTRLATKPNHIWKLGAEFADMNLIPRSDPNAPTQVHRIMLAQAIVTLAQTSGGIMNLREAIKQALATIGVSHDNIATLVPDPQPQPAPPDPKVALATAKLQQGQAKMGLDAQEQQRKAATEEVEAKQHATETSADMQNAAADRASKESIAAMQEETERMRLVSEQQAAAHKLAASVPHVETATAS